jgi:predicted nucleic acid-binding protein
MTYVFDASFVGALLIPDEKDRRVDDLYDSIQNEDVKFVPQLLWYEIGNVFKTLVLRERYAYNEVLAFIPHLKAMRLSTDAETGAGYTEKLLRIGQSLGVTAYDAAYLELAARKHARLCVLDGRLRSAAERYGVDVLE